MNSVLEDVTRISDPGELFEASWSLMRIHFRSLVVPWTLIMILFQIFSYAYTYKWFNTINSEFPFPHKNEEETFQSFFSPSFFVFIAMVLLVPILMALFAGSTWYNFQLTLYTGKIRTLWQGLSNVIPRIFPFLGTSLLLFIFISCGCMMCILPGLLAIFMFGPAPFLSLEKGVGPLTALKRTQKLLRLRTPGSRLVKTGWGKLGWVIVGIWSIQSILNMTVGSLSAAISFFITWVSDSPIFSKILISQILQLPAQFLQTIAYILTIAAMTIVIEQARLFYEAPDLVTTLDNWLQTLE